VDLSLIKSKIKAIEPKLVEIRRDLHRYPELSNREFRTAEKIANHLDWLGLQVQRGVAKTGVVALLKGKLPGPTVGIRADMDALPIQEDNDVSYKSLNDGVQHACGHDVHTTIVLGVAETLTEFRDYLRGSVKFVFQPAEEGPPAGERGGASLMVEEGVLANPPVEAVFGLHVMPTLEVGKIGYHNGPVWASNDTLEILIVGRKTHGAYPHTGIDPVPVAAHVLLALQTMVSRSIDIRDPLLISVGILEGGNQFNVITDRVRMVGIIRCLSPETRAASPQRIEEVLRGITQSFGASYSLRITPGAPVTLNHPGLVEKAVPLLEELLGPDNVMLQKPQMGAEDFACFAERVPGIYLWLGVRNETRGITEMLHTPRFNVDESCISVGIEALSGLVTQHLAQAKDKVQ
jgi:amidohydrolase